MFHLQGILESDYFAKKIREEDGEIGFAGGERYLSDRDLAQVAKPMFFLIRKHIIDTRSSHFCEKIEQLSRCTTKTIVSCRPSWDHRLVFNLWIHTDRPVAEQLIDHLFEIKGLDEKCTQHIPCKCYYCLYDGYSSCYTCRCYDCVLEKMIVITREFLSK